MMPIRGIRIKLNPAGIRAFLQSDEVQKDLQRRVDKIAEAAGDGFEGSVEVVGGSSKLGRAMGYVTAKTPKARKAQAEDPVLQRALDAGR